MSHFAVVAALFVCLAVILGGQGSQAAIARVKLANPGKLIQDHYYNSSIFYILSSLPIILYYLCVSKSYLHL